MENKTVSGDISTVHQKAPPPSDLRARGLRRGRLLRFTLLLLGPLLVIAVGSYIYLTGGRFVETDNAFVKADKVMIAAEVSGLISSVSVRENQRVEKGDELFRINDHSYRIALMAAEAGLANARDRIASLKATHRQKQEELALARTNIAFAQREFERQSKLISSSAGSRAKLDATRHELDIARQQLDVIAEEIAEITAQLGGNPDIPVEQHSLYLAALAEKEKALLDLERTVVRAPFAGIASNTPQVGQQVIGNGAFSSAVMSLISDQDVWIEANFKETDLTHVRPGQNVTITIDTYPGETWHGTVESVAQATGAEFSVIPPQNASGNWVKVVQRIPVRIRLDERSDDLPLRAGMSSVVEIDTGYSRPVPAAIRTTLDWFGADTKLATAEAAPGSKRP